MSFCRLTDCKHLRTISRFSVNERNIRMLVFCFPCLHLALRICAEKHCAYLSNLTNSDIHLENAQHAV